MSASNILHLPSFYDPKKADQIYRVPYETRFEEAIAWAKKQGIKPAILEQGKGDKLKVCLLIVDGQITFCLPGSELFVGGMSGIGAVDDNRRLAEFIYRNLPIITKIAPTLDTHRAFQIFHRGFLVNDKGEHPGPYTSIPLDSVLTGVWKVNPAAATAINQPYTALQAYLVHYCQELKKSGKLDLYIWPHHAMIGSIGHALAPILEEACFFHSIARASVTEFETKGLNPVSENYSVLRPEVLTGPKGQAVAQKNVNFFKKLMSYDRLIIAGQAKSHCVAWTIADLLAEIKAQDPELAQKVYLMEDCTSSVVVKDDDGKIVMDFSPIADKAFADFAAAGMHIVRSTDPVSTWKNFGL